MIQNINDFISIAIENGFTFPNKNRVENELSFDIMKSGITLNVEFKRKKIGLYKKEITGLVIKRPYYLLGRYDRSNSGQIIITFGKSKNDVFQKINNLIGEIQQYQKNRIAKNNLEVQKRAEIAEVAQRFERTRIVDNGFFIYFPDCKNLENFKSIAEITNEIYYSHSHRKFVVTDSMLPKGGIKHSYDRNPVNLDEFFVFVEKVNKLNDQIKIINEKYFGQQS